jgi:hypothetical protein
MLQKRCDFNETINLIVKKYQIQQSTVGVKNPGPEGNQSRIVNG